MSPTKKRIVWGVAILILLLLSCRLLPAALDAMNAAINSVDWAAAGTATGEWIKGIIMWVLELF
jgi:hypothetical protein